MQMSELMKNDSKWARLIGASALMMVMGVLYAWSIFRDPLSNMFGTWTAVNLSWIFTISMLSLLCGGIVSGRLTMRIKYGYIVLISTLLCFIGFFGASNLDANDPAKSLIMMNVFYGIFCGFGIGMSYNAILGAMLKWFPGKEGLASGILLMGFGFGGLLLGNIIGMLITGYGINQTFIILAIGIAVIAGGGSFIIKEPVLTMETMHAGLGKSRDTVLPIFGELRPSQMVKTASFFILILWMISITMGGLMVMNSAASIASFYGFSAGTGLIATVFNGVGRMSSGILFDRFGNRMTMMIVAGCLIVSSLLMMAGVMWQYYPLIIIGLPFTGLGYGGAPVVASAYVNCCYGSKNYASNLSVANLSVMVSSIAGPVLSGSLQDMSNGAFEGSFVAIGVMGVIAFIIAFFVKKYHGDLVFERCK